MAQLATPNNFTVIRSDDRLSAFFAWDSVLYDTAGATATAEQYTLNMSELNNGLGYAPVKDVPHKPDAPQQFTSTDGLDPDVLYSFTIVAEKEAYAPSAPTAAATDF